MCVGKISRKLSVYGSIITVAIGLWTLFINSIASSATANEHLTILWSERTDTQKAFETNSIQHEEIKKDVEVIKNDVSWIKTFLQKNY